MNVGIIGVGVTGNALKEYFMSNTDHEVFLNDPRLGYDDDFSTCDAIFLCLPSPTIDGRQDLRIIESVIDCLPVNADVFLRSTVLPGTCDEYGVWAMPEFLTERSAVDDMFSMGIITGCPKAKLLDDLFPDKEVTMVTNVEAELVKYAHNCFGAIKVNYFNVIYEICQRLGANYENVREGVLLSGYINEPHTKVPGPDGHFGFGGHCFPKDISAFFQMFKYGIFKETILDNARFRHNVGSASIRFEKHSSNLSS